MLVFSPSRRGTSLEPLPTPPAVGSVTPKLTVALEFLGETTPERRALLSNELGVFLADFYGRAFLADSGSPQEVGAEPSDSTTIPRPDSGGLVSPEAHPAFIANRPTFAADGIRIYEGTVSFRGVVTATNDAAFGATVGVVFEGLGNVERELERAASIYQFGSLRLISTPEGWRIAGFDLKLETRVALTLPDETAVPK